MIFFLTQFYTHKKSQGVNKVHSMIIQQIFGDTHHSEPQMSTSLRCSRKGQRITVIWMDGSLSMNGSGLRVKMIKILPKTNKHKKIGSHPVISKRLSRSPGNSVNGLCSSIQEREWCYEIFLYLNADLNG